MKKSNVIILIIIAILAYLVAKRSGKLSMFSDPMIMKKPVGQRVDSVADIAVESGACGFMPQMNA
jgi:hypothetical protein